MQFFLYRSTNNLSEFLTKKNGDGSVTANNEPKKMRKEAAVDYFAVLVQWLSTASEKNQENPGHLPTTTAPRSEVRTV
jgi:hypothetical protein